MSRERPPNSGTGGMPSWTIPGLFMALILAAGIAFAGYEIGHGSSPPAAATPTPTSTPSPTSTPNAASTATVASPTPTARTPVAQPTATLWPKSQRLADEAVIRGHGYVPGQWAWSGDHAGGRIWGWIATCAHSADGYCQNVFFFHNTTFLGTDTTNPSRQILVIIGEGNLTPGLSVQYANYKASDAMCCPSGKPVTIMYTWNGSRIVASGTPPGQ